MFTESPHNSRQQVRKEVHTKLPLTLFVRVNRVAVEFIRDVQHLCGQPCHALGTELQQHANAFLDATHAEAARKLEAIVEVEQWKQARHCCHHIGALGPPLTGVGLRLPRLTFRQTTRTLSARLCGSKCPRFKRPSC